MLILLINYIANIIILLVLINILLSFFVPTYNSIRQTLDQIVAPMLNPIRQRMPHTGMFDFSALILILLVQLIASILIGIIRLF